MTVAPVQIGPPGPPVSETPPQPAPAPAEARADLTTLPLAPAFCGVCGDQPSEPAALTEDFDFRTSADTFLALRCRSCGGIFLSPAATEDARDRIFPPEYFARHVSRWRHTPTRGGQVLDLGPSSGMDQLEQLARTAPSYDLIRLDLTLECAPDALALLAAVRAALRPGGQAVVLLNHLRSPAFGWFGGRHWGGYDAPRQRRVLTLDGLGRLARAANLDLAGTAMVAAGEPWVRSFRRLCEDWSAPAWLTARFADRSLLGRAFKLVDLALRPLGRSALIVATLRRPETPAR